jgi:hypothetical protein
VNITNYGGTRIMLKPFKFLRLLMLALPLVAMAQLPALPNVSLPALPNPGSIPGLAIPTIPPAVLPSIPTTQVLGGGANILPQNLTNPIVLPAGTVFTTPTTIPGVGVIPSGTVLTQSIRLPANTIIGNISVPPGVHVGLMPTAGMVHNGLVTAVNGTVVSSLAAGTIPVVGSLVNGLSVPCIPGTNNLCYNEVPRDNDPFVFCTEGSKKHNVILTSIVPPLSPGRIMIIPALAAYSPPLNYPSEIIVYLEIWPTTDRPDTDNYGWFGIPLPPFFHREKRNLWLGTCLGRKQGDWTDTNKAANQVPNAH